MLTTNNMQTLPANGQAQPLPANPVQPYEIGKKYNLKWDDGSQIIEETAVYKMHTGRGHNVFVCDEGGILLAEDILEAVEITDSQFKAMVEGESRPKWEGKLNQACQELEDNETRKKNILIAYEALLVAGEHEAAAALKAKHPDIWPVDYAAIVLEKAVAWYTSACSEIFKHLEAELEAAVRNYLTNQK